MRERFFLRTMVANCVAFTVISAVAMHFTGLYFDPHQLAQRAAIVGSVVIAMFGLARFAEYRGSTSLRDMAIISAWTIIISQIHIIPMFAATRAGLPMRDGELAWADHAIGAYLPGIVGWVSIHPLIQTLSGVCYESLLLLIVLPSIIPPLCGHSDSSRKFIVATVASAVIAYPIMFLFQAVGPWDYYGYTPQINQHNYMAMLAELRSSHRMVLDLEYKDGLISFPSFHTSAAVLSAVALWSTPYFRWVAAVWAALIVVSTVTTGTHYVVDTIAGLALCVAAQWTAHAYGILETRFSRLSS